jgi:hypothetical protein
LPRLATINSLPPNLIYKSASETAKELVPQLRAQGADLIVAVTHQREPNDNKLAEKVPPGLIDLILGGHDHYYAHTVVNSCHVLRSGSDFKQLSYIEAWRKKDGPGWDFTITRRDVVRAIPEHPETVELLETMSASMRAKLQKPIGYTATPLDGRFTTVRRKESNLANFVCDLMRTFYDADCCIMAAGTVRGDQVYPPGVLRIRDILNCFPFEDPVVVLRVKGKAIRAALENGVGQLPALEGRFPQVSNINFAYSASKPRGSRISWIKLGGKDLDDEKGYSVATRGYMGRGKDGYDALLIKSEGGEAEELVSEEDGILLSTLMRQFFLSVKVIGKWHHFSKSLGRHWDSVNSKLHHDSWIRSPSTSSLSASGNLKESGFQYVARTRVKAGEDDGIDSESDSEDEVLSRPRTYVTKNALTPEDGDRKELLARRFLLKWRRKVGVDDSKVGTVDEACGDELPQWTHVIAPTVEARIVQLDSPKDEGHEHS